MSNLQDAAQSISVLRTNAEDAISQVMASSKQVNEMLSLTSNLMQGTGQQGYQELVNQLSISQKKLGIAADNLVRISKLGDDWLKEHITSNGTEVGTSNNYIDTFASEESEAYEELVDTDNNVLIEDENQSEDVKVKRITREEAHERYKNGLEDINERLENHKEALMARGVPDGEWLRKILAIEKALMTQQLANDIEVARGQTEPQNIYNVLESGEDGLYKFYDDMAQSYFDEKGAVGPCIDWKTQPECNRTNIALNLNKTNPNFSLSAEWSVNCQRCVPTYEMRRRGYDVTAFSKTDNNDYLCRHPFDVWKNPDIIHTTGSGEQSIIERMTEWGDGARAQVVVVWRGVPSGHTFIAENIQGEVRFIDPQNGDEDVSRYFNRVEENLTMFCRIDNQVPSDYVLQCSKEVRINDQFRQSDRQS